MEKIDFGLSPPHGRATGLHRALELVHESLTDDRPPNIVETGCIRSLDFKYSDGHSTLLFGWYCQQYGGSLYTLEIDQGALNLCKGLTKQYEENISYVLGDASSNILVLEVEQIDLLYLDSANDAQITLNEYNASKNFLHSNSVIVVDDVLIGHKGKLVGPQMISDGWTIETLTADNGSYLCTRKGLL